MTPEQARVAADGAGRLLAREWTTTAKVLAAIPEDQKHYRPHEKSRTAWEIATHIARIDVWFLTSVLRGRFEPPSGAIPETVAGLVEWYSREFPAVLHQVLALPDAALAESLDFMGRMQQPRAGFLHLTLLHMVHHRGQLSVYLRPMGGKVPAIYGGSGDEAM